MGWPMDKADYFSAHGYIRPQRAIKFGIFWPFYMQPSRNKAVSASGSLGGGNASSSDSGGGMMSGFGGGGGGRGGGLSRSGGFGGSF